MQKENSKWINKTRWKEKHKNGQWKQLKNDEKMVKMKTERCKNKHAREGKIKHYCEGCNRLAEVRRVLCVQR